MFGICGGILLDTWDGSGMGIEEKEQLAFTTKRIIFRLKVANCAPFLSVLQVGNILSIKSQESRVI